MGSIANILPFGNAAGPHYQLDYSTATSAGITTMSQATLASTNGVANIINPSPDGTCVRLRADVDVDPIASNGYPRAEWRELATDGTTLRAFNRTTGDHKCEVLVRPLHLPPFKPSFVFLQIHDANGDLLECAIQPRSDFATTGKMEAVLRIDDDGTGSSSVGIPKLIADFGTVANLGVGNKWIYAWARVGAIGPSGVAGWQVHCNGTTIQSWDSGMPGMWTTGASGSYYKSGMYLQTKWTGSGTGGLETDRNEYGEADWRVFKTYHNGETAPLNPSSVGTALVDAVSNVRAGTKASAHRTVTDTAIQITPGLPASLAEGDMMFCIVRSSRGTNTTAALTSAAPKPTTAPSSPTMSAAQGTWERILSAHMSFSNSAPLVGAYTGGPELQAHTVRWLLFAKKWQSGDAAPTVDVASGTTLTDTISGVIVACSDVRVSNAIEELLDKLPAGIDAANPNDNNTTTGGITYAAATSTTQLGPTGTITGAAPGSLAIACVYHETNVASGSIAVVAGTDSPALTWAELCEGIITTIPGAAGSLSEDEPAWAVDYAIVPGTAGQNIVAKTAAATIAADANKPNTGTAVPGRGWGVLFTVQPARRRRRGPRAACTVG